MKVNDSLLESHAGYRIESFSSEPVTAHYGSIVRVYGGGLEASNSESGWASFLDVKSESARGPLPYGSPVATDDLKQLYSTISTGGAQLERKEYF